MKKLKSTLILLVALCATLPALAQDLYWVFLTDKQGSTFDPYSYFDAKAIERYRLNNANLYDISNFPLSPSYVSQVSALASEQLGQSRWLNAMAVTATPDQINAIRLLPFVRDTRLIATDMQLAQHLVVPSPQPQAQATAPIQGLVMADQLLRMRGDIFRANNIDGHGVRIAVFDNGFPSVDKHKVFKHLRDNHQIIATWNFPDKKENVYGPGGHGTMVLSCIAGIYDSLQLGLATGAEFLLARTEIEAEPFKEEVWWMMAVEWADKNGADIINSSLGYGKDRHYTYEMDGRSYVAKAANMAARKGILVCNSAGNEGDDNKWKTIITPADADSVLCVGGIQASLSSYQHISFSSFGPSADGRLKPNVCNFGQAIVAKPRTTDQSESVFGTSFSSPLTAGFCACAKQARPDLSAMQLKEAVEHSADLYPYFDYAFGYGVPQASYFVGPTPQQPQPTFSFVDHGSYITISPNGSHLSSIAPLRFDPSASDTSTQRPKHTIFFKVSDKKGNILQYTNLEFDQFGPDKAIAFPKGGLYNKTLTASFGGFSDSYRLSDVDAKQALARGNIGDYDWTVIDSAGFYVWNYDRGIDRTPDDLRINEFSDKWKLDLSFGCGIGLATSSDQLSKVPIQGIIDLRISRQLRRWYSLGIGIGFDITGATFANGSSSPVDAYLGLPTTGLGSRRLTSTGNYAELFQRIRIIPGGITHNGHLWWDLGFFAQASFVNYDAQFSFSNANFETLNSSYSNIAAFDQIFGYGISTRLMYDIFGLYARYRLSGQPGAQAAGLDLPRLNIGITLDI